MCGRKSGLMLWTLVATATLVPRPATAQPDLLVRTINVDWGDHSGRSLGPGRVFSVSAYIKNAGDVDIATPVRAAMWLDSPPDPNQCNFEPLTTSGGIPAGGEATIVWQSAYYYFTTPGDHTVYVLVDPCPEEVVESHEDNNLASTTVTVEQPDLQPLVSDWELNIEQGQPFTLTFEVDNPATSSNGSLPPVDFYVGYSRDSSIAPESCESMDPVQLEDNHLSFTRQFPGYTANGIYLFWFTVDCNGEVPDRVVSNNQAVVHIYVSQSDPKVTSITPNVPNPSVGQPIAFDVEVTNVGFAPTTKPFRVSFSSGAVSVAPFFCQIPQYVTISPPLDPNESTIVRFRDVVYGAPGTYHPMVVVDDCREVQERDEDEEIYTPSNLANVSIDVAVRASGFLWDLPSAGVREDAGHIDLLLRRDSTDAAAGVDLVVGADSTASPDADFTFPAHVDFAAGEDAQTVVVSILNDTLVEGSEEIVLGLANPSAGATIAEPAEVRVTIEDDDAPAAGVVQFSAAAGGVREVSPTAPIAVLRSGGAVGAVSVSYHTLPGTATPDEDYTPVEGTLSWPADDDSQQVITLPLINTPDVLEPTETLQVELFNPTGGAVLGTQSRFELSIYDLPGRFQFSQAAYPVDEPAQVAVLTVTRTVSTSGDATVFYETRDGNTLVPANVNAIAPGDYVATSGSLVFADGETEKSITAPIVDDADFEYQEHFSVVLTNGSEGVEIGDPAEAEVSISSDDYSDQAPATFNAPPCCGGNNNDGNGNAAVAVALPLALVVMRFSPRRRHWFK